MKIYHMRVLPGELPAGDRLTSKTVTMLVPFKGWVPQENSSSRPALPMAKVSLQGVERWVKEKTRRFQPKKGYFVLAYRLEDEGYSFGLYHDTRRYRPKEKVELEGVALPAEVHFD